MGFLKDSLKGGIGFAGINKLFGEDGDPETIRQEAMLTDEQKRAMGLLQQFGETGRAAGISPYGGPLGNFNMTGIEQQGQNLLAQLLNSGQPQALTDATGILRSIAGEEFDSDSPLFQTFKKGVLRSAGDASDILNRESAITGSRFGTQIGREKGVLAERTQDTLASQLAQMIQNSQNTRLNAATGLANAGVAGENIINSRLNQAATFGSLDRLLKNAEAQAKLQQFESNKAQQLGALQGVFNRNVPFGVKELTLPGQPGPLSGLLNTALSAGGAALGNMIIPGIGGMIGGQIGGAFGGGSSSGSGGFDVSSLFSGGGGLSSGNVSGTGLFGSRLGGQTQSEILGKDTRQFRSSF